METQASRIDATANASPMGSTLAVQVAKSFANAVEETADAVLITDPNGHIEYVNPAFECTTGFRQDEVLGKTPRILKSGRHPLAFYETMWRTILLGNVFRATVVNRKRNGDLYHAEQTITPVRDSAGRITHFVSLIRDISERIHTQELLQQQASELERSNRELQQFASVLAHDLAEPQRTAFGFAQLLDRRFRSQLGAEAGELLDFLVSELARMGDMIHGLLDLCRVSTRGSPMEPIDLSEVWEQAIAHLQASIAENGAAVTHAGLPTVLGDSEQLVCLFQNLIGNAVKFRRSEPPRVEISSEKQDHEWLFSVRDNGIGFDPDEADRLFVIFKRLGNAHDVPGTGIGLSLCKSIVERHGGRIWAESRGEQGSVFSFTLPIRELHGQQHAPSATPMSAAVGAARQVSTSAHT